MLFALPPWPRRNIAQQFLSRQAVKIRRHLEENRKDLEARKGLNRTEAKIRRLVKYYRKKGVLEPNFKYDPEKIKIFLR